MDAGLPTLSPTSMPTPVPQKEKKKKKKDKKKKSKDREKSKHTDSSKTVPGSDEHRESPADVSKEPATEEKSDAPEAKSGKVLMFDILCSSTYHVSLQDEAETEFITSIEQDDVWKSLT